MKQNYSVSTNLSNHIGKSISFYGAAILDEKGTFLGYNKSCSKTYAGKLSGCRICRGEIILEKSFLRLFKKKTKYCANYPSYYEIKELWEEEIEKYLEKTKQTAKRQINVKEELKRGFKAVEPLFCFSLIVINLGCLLRAEDILTEIIAVLGAFCCSIAFGFTLGRGR